ncbi:serine/threonine protein kinase, partial [Myxococcota bacterium]|nr:serine/threonine protein kinase [Myxococcota bacterium]
MRIGRHTVLFELARGGMAEVFVTLPDGGRAPCVLKRPLGGPAASAALGHRFRREGAIVSRLDHPNIAKVVEVGTTEPPFLAFEYVAGQTVEHLLETL